MIIVIGDIMLDINNKSIVNRKAPEADIPIYDLFETDYKLGGAANVSYNLHSLDTNTELISVVGDDFHGQKIKEILISTKIPNTVFLEKERKTTQKNRIFVKDAINVRFDIEDSRDILRETADDILQHIDARKDIIDAIVISDYDKGVISEYLCTKLISFANKHEIRTFVDPKISNYKKYINCFCIKPNLNELHNLINHQEGDNIETMLKNIKDTLNCENVLLTLGQDGIILFNKWGLNTINNKLAVNVRDVTGSGDLVLSVLVHVYFKEHDLLHAAKTANYIASKGVSFIGNYVTSLADIEEYKLLSYDKVIYDYELEKIHALSKKQNTVFTNGCFDILHSAHIKLLQFSKKQGDLLVVGLNSDASIKRIKGEKRPINNLEERNGMLSLFDFIDYIIIFTDDTPYNIISHLKPNIIVKGSDYTKEEVVGNEFAKKVVLFDLINNKSSTNIITKIKNM